MTGVAGSEPLTRLLGRAICYGWAARLFFYPDPGLSNAFGEGRAQSELAEAVAQLKRPVPAARALSVLCAAWDERQRGDPSLAEEHSYLFARQVPVSPYEGAYRSDLSAVPPSDLAEMAALYAAFGLRVAQRAWERPDHVSLELEFLAALLSKQAYALERRWDARVRVVAQARARFVQEHLAAWFPQFAERLTAHARFPFYPTTARFAQCLLDQEPVPAVGSHRKRSEDPNVAPV